MHVGGQLSTQARSLWAAGNKNARDRNQVLWMSTGTRQGAHSSHLHSSLQVEGRRPSPNAHAWGSPPVT